MCKEIHLIVIRLSIVSIVSSEDLRELTQYKATVAVCKCVAMLNRRDREYKGMFALPFTNACDTVGQTQTS